MSALRNAEPALDAVRDGADGARVGLAVVDVHTGERFASADTETFEAASVIKVPIVLAVLRAVQDGRLRLDDEVPVPREAVVGGSGVIRELPSVRRLSVRDLVTLTVVVSDNTATNLLIDLLGGVDPVNALLDEVGATGTRLGRKLMDLDARARGEHNVLTASDVAGLFTGLVRGELLDGALTREVLDVLARQQVRDRLPRQLPDGVRVAHKTGELGGIRHDAGVLYLGAGGDVPVVAVVLTERFTDVTRTDVGADVGRVLYDAYG